MTQFYQYRQAIDASPTWTVALDTPVRLGDLEGLTELAEHMASGSSTLVFDDPDADLGHNGDAILGNQRFEIIEDACSAPRLYSGFIGARTYSRGDSDRSSLLLGASRQISVELHDYNAYASMRIIPQTNRDAIRPAETVDDRFTWITGTGYLAAVSDTGYVASNTTMMDKADYRGQSPINVLADCELTAGFGWNCFIFWDDATTGPAWFFDNSNTSTAFSSTLRISNVITDLDTLTAAEFLTGTTFPPSKDAKLTRDPTELGDSAYLPYRNGAAFRTRAATTDTYGQKDVVAPNANVGTRARANALADDFLFQHRNEEDRITLTVEVPPSKVNLIKAGHRIQCKFQHLPGYEDWTWFRVLRRSPAQRLQTDDRYEMELELSPQEGGCSVQPTLVQHSYQHLSDATGPTAPNYTFTFDFPSATGIGNLICAAVLHGTQMVATPSGWTAAFTNENTVAAGTNRWCSVFYKRSAGDTSISLQVTGAVTDFRVDLTEYAGLTNPVLDSSVLEREDPNAGGATQGAVAFPAGPALIIGHIFTDDGPTGSDDWFITNSGDGTPNLRSAGGTLVGAGEIALTDVLLDTTSGSAEWFWGNTGTLGGNYLSALVFTGDAC